MVPPNYLFMTSLRPDSRGRARLCIRSRFIKSCDRFKTMGDGRLIRVSRFRGDPKAASYLVAIPNKGDALELIASQAAMPGDEVEDLGRVSEALITTLRLSTGQFMPVNGVRHVAQLEPGPLDE